MKMCGYNSHKPHFAGRLSWVLMESTEHRNLRTPGYQIIGCTAVGFVQKPIGMIGMMFAKKPAENT